MKNNAITLQGQNMLVKETLREEDGNKGESGRLGNNKIT